MIPIYTRSPRFISYTGNASDEIRVDLYVWNSPSSEPASPTYVLSKPIPSTAVDTVHFNISDLVRENISFDTFVPVTTETALGVTQYCYCNAYVYQNGTLQDTYNYICFDGYGYFLEGNNPDVNPVHLNDGTYYYETSNTDFGGFVLYDDGLSSWTVKYTNLVSGAFTTSVVSETVGLHPLINSAYVSDGNEVSIYKDTILQNTLRVEAVCEAKYDIYKCDFVNKNGTWQRINFFKTSKESFDMTSKSYNMMPENIDYSLSKNIKQSFNINGQDKVMLSTGWVNDGYAEVVKQLMLSEEVRLNDVPATVSTKNLELKKGINDNNINYMVEFMYSFSTINDIV